MPSKNFQVEFTRNHRVNINICEGEVTLSDEWRVDERGWRTDKKITLSADQAAAVAAKILSLTKQPT